MNAFAHRQYEILAKLVGESVNFNNFRDNLIKMFEEDNAKFDKERFLKAVDKARAQADIKRMEE